mgnify:CR=1 FL=1
MRVEQPGCLRNGGMRVIYPCVQCSSYGFGVCVSIGSYCFRCLFFSLSAVGLSCPLFNCLLSFVRGYFASYVGGVAGCKNWKTSRWLQTCGIGGGWVLMPFSPIEGVRFHASDNDSAEKVCPCSEVDIWCLFDSRFTGGRQSCCSNHNMEGP